jgi:hypothetical protein
MIYCGYKFTTGVRFDVASSTQEPSSGNLTHTHTHICVVGPFSPGSLAVRDLRLLAVACLRPLMMQ